MDNDVTSPKGSMGVLVTPKSKMAAVFYLVLFDYSTAQPHQNTGQYYCYLNFPFRGNTTLYSIRS